MILPHAQRDDLAAEMVGFYVRLDRTIAAHGPTCQNRGLCCNFGRYGHKLFVTTVELAYFVRGHHHGCRVPTTEDACPFQVGGLCTAREHRPMGCRIFFCDPQAAAWQNEEYEAQLRTLKGISAAYGVDYRYTEWMGALRETGLAVTESSPGPPSEAVKPTMGIDPIPLPVVQSV